MVGKVVHLNRWMGQHARSLKYQYHYDDHNSYDVDGDVDDFDDDLYLKRGL